MRLPHLAVTHNWRKKVNMSGLYSVHIRIKIGEESKYYWIQVPRKIKTNEWIGEEINGVLLLMNSRLRSTIKSGKRKTSFLT
jgi:hypothetical protein